MWARRDGGRRPREARTAAPTFESPRSPDPWASRLHRGAGMNVLVVYGSRMGGTAGLARAVAGALRDAGHQADVREAGEAGSLEAFDAVVVGGALYAFHWVRSAARFVRRHADELRALPVFFFSSGPLDASAEEGEIPPTPSVRRLMDLVGAREHATFGGRLDETATGWIAHSMAKGGHAGDFRDFGHVRTWAAGIAQKLSALPEKPRHVSRARVRALRLARRAVVALCVFSGVTALGGGFELMAWSGGAPWLPPRALLEHTPFDDFMIPGLILFGAVGLPNVIAAVMGAQRARRAEETMAFAGAMLTGWIVVEMILLRMAHWLQLSYLGVGVATLVLALVLWRERPSTRAPAGSSRLAEAT